MTSLLDRPNRAQFRNTPTIRSLDLRPGIETLTPNAGAELLRYGRAKPGIISLAQGQGEAATPGFICEAVQRALAGGRTFYDSALGLDDLRTEISAYYKRIYKLDIPVQRTFVTSSGTNAVHLAINALLSPGDDVVAVTPIWKNLLSIVELAQGRIREVPMDNNDGVWSLDLDKLFETVTASTRVLLITSPSNPTGWVMPREDIKAVMEFARVRDLWVISDEVYSRLVYDGKHAPSFLEFATDDDKLFVINSFSKTWAMTGWRLGWLVGPKQAEGHIRDMALYNHMGPPTFTQLGAIEALQHGENFLRAQLDLWQDNRAFMMDWVKHNPRVICAEPEAAFYSFFRVDGEPDDFVLCRRLIDEAGVSLAPGSAFGKVGRGYVRLCFAVSREKLGQALDRLEHAI